jgi:hypothetical protein
MWNLVLRWRANGGTLRLVSSGARSIYRFGAMFCLKITPATRLGEMLFEHISGNIDNVGAPGAIYQTLQH